MNVFFSSAQILFADTDIWFVLILNNNLLGISSSQDRFFSEYQFWFCFLLFCPLPPHNPPQHQMIIFFSCYYF